MTTRAFFARQKMRARLRKSSSPLFFVCVGIVGSLLVVAALLQQTVPPRYSFTDPLPRPVFTDFLPAGSGVSDVVLELPDVPQHSYVFGYAQGGEELFGMLTWNKDRNAYVFVSSPKLPEGGTVTRLAVQPLGNGGTFVILAEGATGTLVLRRQDNGLQFVPMIDAQGKTGPAFFLRSISAEHADMLTFEDVNADGGLEVVAASKTFGPKNIRLSENDSVYRFEDGQLVYDKDLSWTLTTSRGLFPAP